MPICHSTLYTKKPFPFVPSEPSLRAVLEKSSLMSPMSSLYAQGSKSMAGFTLGELPARESGVTVKLYTAMTYLIAYRMGPEGENRASLN